MGTIAINADKALSDIEGVAKKAEGTHIALTKLGKTTKDAGTKITKMGKAMLPVTAGVVGVGAASIKTAADFEASMSQVAATMAMTSGEINAGSESYKRLEQAARDMGSKTKYSASEAADALNYLALAGYDVDESINKLPTVLNLAAAADMDLASASDMVTDGMSALGDTAGTCENFVDKMAKTSQKSNTSVSQLGEAILTVGGTAKMLAGGTTELNASLGILADNGIKGAEGGTALRNVILSLSAPTDQAAKLMSDLGVSAFDADGNMRPLNETFKDLDAAMAGMSQSDRANVLSTIFNKVDLKSAEALLANCGGRFDELSGYLNDCDGAAQTMADTMNNNLNGQLTTLKSAVSEAGISIGQALLPTIKSVTEKIQEWTDKFNSLSPAQQQTIIKVAALVAAIAPLLMVIGTLVSGIGSIITVVGTMSSVLSAGGTVISALGAAFGMANVMALAIVAGIAAIIAIGVLLYTHWDEIKAFCIQVWGAIKDYIGQVVDGVKTFFTGLWEHIQNIWDTICNVVQVAVMLLGSILSAAFTIITTPYRFIWENCKEYVFAAWEWIKNAVSTAINAVSSVISSVMGAIQSIWTTVWNAIKSFLSPVINGIKSTITSVFNAIQSTVSNIWNTIKSVTTSVWNGIKSGVSSAVNAVSSTVSSVFNSIKSTATSVWNSIKSAITGPIDAAKEHVRNAVNSIKGFFSNLTLKLPHIKLPHFSLSGSFSLNPPSVPHLSVSWYKKAMENPYMFTQPTLFDINPMTGTARGAGEAGDEVMIGKDTMLNMIQTAVATETNGMALKLQRIIDLLVQFFPDVLAGLDRKLVLDTGVLVGQTAPAMDKALGKIAIRKGRGR